MKTYASLLLTFLLMLLSLGSQAQTPTTQGTEFWLSFMRNGYRSSKYERLTLIASAKQACEVTVTNPAQNWEETISVGDNGVATLEISDAYGYNDQQGGKAYKGLYVSSTDTISLYIANEADNSYDAANVLPIQALGSYYMLQSNKSIGEQSNHLYENRASLLVVATQNGTEVSITPSCKTWDGHEAGQMYTVSLDAGECYHVMNLNVGTEDNEDGDFSGTLVASDEEKPIAVFNGNTITSVPGGLSTGYDHVFEQAMPTADWGKRFVVTSIYPAYTTLSADLVKVTALNDQTTVTRDGVTLAQLDSGESVTFSLELSSSPCSYLESDAPIAVYVYNHSHATGNTVNYGDPSMVWIAPVEQTIYEVTFSTFQAENITDHFVNVVCYTDHIADLTLDGNSIVTSFVTVPAAPDFSYARVVVEQGAHTLRCPGGFVAYVYGYGDVEGYAYTVGSSAKILTKQLYVDDILSTELPDGYAVCQHESVQFRVETNYAIDHVEWDFGDNASDTGEEVEHAYTAAGDFEVMSVVYREIDGSVQAFDTLGVTIHVDPVMEYHINETTCFDTYEFHGVSYPVPYQDEVVISSEDACDTIYHLNIQYGTTITYTETRTECNEYEWFDSTYTETNHHIEHWVYDATPEHCDSLYVLDLTIANPPENPERSYASCDTWYWYDIECSETGDYTKTFQTEEGCVYDSILHFELIPNGDASFTIEACDHYMWQGIDCTLSGTYYDTIIGNNGCESYLTLHLTLYPTPPFDEILGLSNVAVATNFWPGEYVYYLDDSTGMDTSEILWELSDNEDEEWDFKPHGASCTIITYTRTSKVLTATAGNDLCEKSVSMTINCSGYAVEEDAMIPMEVFPNPANHELFVKGEEMESVVLYDLLGQRVKEVSVDDGTLTRVDLNGLPSALYLVQVRTRKGNKTQLVSVTE